MLSSNSITFRITNLGIDHTKILIRANAYTACTAGNRSVNLIVESTNVSTLAITSANTLKVIESDAVAHIKSTAMFTI